MGLSRGLHFFSSFESLPAVRREVAVQEMNSAWARGYRLGFVLAGPEADRDLAVAWDGIAYARDRPRGRRSPLLCIPEQSFPKYIQLSVSAFGFTSK